MKKWVFLDPHFVPGDEAAIPFNDLALQRGYAVFDFLRMKGGLPLFAEAHLARFRASASALRLPLPTTDETLQHLLFELARRNGVTDTGMRLTLTGGASSDGFSVGKPQLLIAEQPFTPPTAQQFEKGIRLASYAYRRQLPAEKTTDYIMGIWLREWIGSQGADEVLYHEGGAVSETPRSNFFIVNEAGTLVTPGEGILFGITRGHVLEAARELLPVTEGPLTLEDIGKAKEAFVCSTTKPVLPVVSVDGRPVGEGVPGPVTRQLAASMPHRYF